MPFKPFYDLLGRVGNHENRPYLPESLNRAVKENRSIYTALHEAARDIDNAEADSDASWTKLLPDRVQFEATLQEVARYLKAYHQSLAPCCWPSG